MLYKDENPVVKNQSTNVCWVCWVAKHRVIWHRCSYSVCSFAKPLYWSYWSVLIARTIHCKQRDMQLIPAFCRGTPLVPSVGLLSEAWDCLRSRLVVTESWMSTDYWANWVIMSLLSLIWYLVASSCFSRKDPLPFSFFYYRFFIY